MGLSIGCCFTSSGLRSSLAISRNSFATDSGIGVPFAQRCLRFKIAPQYC
jgi:hypothetical protein